MPYEAVVIAKCWPVMAPGWNGNPNDRGHATMTYKRRYRSLVGAEGWIRGLRSAVQGDFVLATLVRVSRRPPRRQVLWRENAEDCD